MNAEKIKEHRKILRAQGICTRCLKREVEGGFKQCAECRVILRENLKKLRKKKGRCDDCLSKLKEGEGFLCDRCKPKRRKRRREWRAKHPERCHRCDAKLGEFNLLIGRKTCERCLHKKTVLRLKKTAIML